MAVRSAYTWDKVVADIRASYAAKRSFRRVAREDLGGRVSHAVVARIVGGVEPHKPEIRQALGLPPLVTLETGPGVAIASGAILIASSRTCPCGRPFIPNHPSRTHCPSCRPPRKRERRLT